MTTDVPCSSGQWLKQESDTVFIDGVLAGKSSKNNISVRTGEEFSMEFLQDRGTVSQVYNGHCRVPSNGAFSKSNGNNHFGYEELNVMLGLQRVDSVCSSDVAESTSARGYLSRPSAISAIDSVPSLAHQPLGSGVSDDSLKGKVKFICSSGGKILPRPSDGKLRYVGGETHIVSIQKNISLVELVKRTSEYCDQPHTIKYQLPGEDLDALISVSSQEDLQNMIEEYDGLGNLDGSQRLRIFLIPLSESEVTCTVETNANPQKNQDYHYVVAVNGIVDHNLIRNNTSQCLPNEVSQLKSDLLEDGVGLNSSKATPQFFEPPSPVKSPNEFPLNFPDLIPQKELMNGHAQVNEDLTSDSIAIPIPKGRAFHSENPISQSADPTDPFLGSKDGSHLGIPHAFSDPQLQELGGSSCVASKDGNILPPTLSFEPPTKHIQLESVVLQEKSVENVLPQVFIEIPSSKHPVSYSQIDSLQGSFHSEFLRRVHDAANCIDEKIQIAKEDPRKNVGVQNNSKENLVTYYQAVNSCKSTLTATVLTSASDAEMQQYSSNHLEKSPAVWSIFVQCWAGDSRQIEPKKRPLLSLSSIPTNCFAEMGILFKSSTLLKGHSSRCSRIDKVFVSPKPHVPSRSSLLAVLMKSRRCCKSNCLIPKLRSTSVPCVGVGVVDKDTSKSFQSSVSSFK